MKQTIEWAERGLIPDPILRWGIRRLVAQRLGSERARYGRSGDSQVAQSAWLEQMRSGPIAPLSEKANEQHYEVPAAFYELVLGARAKYSSALWEPGTNSLDEAEEAMLALTAERADLADGQSVLELGCGWGSLTLWMAERFPRSRIVAVSNSAGQREHVLRLVAERRIANVEVRTADMNAFTTDERFERVVSVEMFEHMRNWESLLGRLHGWLVPDGRFFAHVFAHRAFAYPFETGDASDWMAARFFSGGMMPSNDLFARVCARAPFEVDAQWRVDGTHYARTAAAWLANLDARAREARAVLASVHGPDQARLWVQRWRMFFMACEELFGYRGGAEWGVVHVRLTPQSAAPAPPSRTASGLSSRVSARSEDVR